MINFILIPLMFLTLNVVEINANKPVDKEAAALAEFTHLQKGCEGGDGKLCYELGTIYMNNYTNESEFKECIRLMQKACDLNVSNGCATLGFTYLEGSKWIEANPQISKEYFKKACELGSGLGCRWMNGEPK